MKKIFLVILCIIFLFSGCTDSDFNSQDVVKKAKTNNLWKGETFSVTGVVDYSDEPSDIGQEYCLITGSEKIEYCYTDIYDEESKWSSNVFYTQGKDTALLKEYVGQKVTVSGIFDAECHGIPYITNITVVCN